MTTRNQHAFRNTIAATATHYFADDFAREVVPFLPNNAIVQEKRITQCENRIARWLGFADAADWLGA